MNNILESFVKIAPYINNLTNSDFSVSVCDLDKCLIYVPGVKHDHKLKSGSPHVKNSVAYDCILKKEKIVKRVESEVFGFPYIAIGIPVFDEDDEDNEIVGTVVFTEAVDRQELLLSLADNLYATMQEMVSITDIISENSLELNNMGQSLKAVTSESKDRVEDTNSILGFIKDVSKNTNMLGINAAIEAARLGQDGKGFMVVADEIRKLSNSTNEYVLKADSIIEELRDSTNRIFNMIDELLNISTNQIDINNNINLLVKDLNEKTEQLQENARSLSE